MKITLIALALFTFCSCSKPPGSADSAGGTQRAATQPAAPSQPAEDAYVSIVRNGTMPGYETTTIGKAFEATFQNSKWHSGQTAKGVTVVQFDGTLPNPEYTQELKDYKSCLAEMEEFKKHSYADYVERALLQENGGVAVLEQAAKVDATAANAANVALTRANAAAKSGSLERERQLRESQAANSLRRWKDAAETLAAHKLALEQDDYAALKGDSSDAKQFQEFYQTVATKCLAKNSEGEELVPVEFQWTFKIDGKSFFMSFVKTDPWEHIPGDFWDVSVAGYRDEVHIAQDSLVNGGRAYSERRSVPVTNRTLSTEKVLAFVYH